MPTHVNPGDSIECSISLIAVRKISKKPVLTNMQCLNGDCILLYKYKTNIRAIVAIRQELNPLQPIILNNSYLTLQDNLEGAVLSIYTKDKFSLDLTSNFSHVHGIQNGNVACFTYATIDAPFPFVLNRHIPQAV